MVAVGKRDLDARTGADVRIWKVERLNYAIYPGIGMLGFKGI
ncbi:MAG: hypothetical protein WCF90_08885 [Methanomicrobiales archaeon]